MKKTFLIFLAALILSAGEAPAAEQFSAEGWPSCQGSRTAVDCFSNLSLSVAAIDHNDWTHEGACYIGAQRDGNWWWKGSLPGETTPDWHPYNGEEPAPYWKGLFLTPYPIFYGVVEGVDGNLAVGTEVWIGCGTGPNAFENMFATDNYALAYTVPPLSEFIVHPFVVRVEWRDIGEWTTPQGLVTPEGTVVVPQNGEIRIKISPPPLRLNGRWAVQLTLDGQDEKRRLVPDADGGFTVRLTGVREDGHEVVVTYLWTPDPPPPDNNSGDGPGGPGGPGPGGGGLPPPGGEA